MTPNRQPKIQAPYKIAIIGEAPGREEEASGEPFIGLSGRFLKALLSRAGINPDSCYFGNISQTRPPNNEIENFSWEYQEIQDGLDTLAHEISILNPNLILCLGNIPLKASKDPETSHPLAPGKFAYSVSNWRGSCFMCTEEASPFLGRKIMCTYHPAAVLRNYEWSPMLQFDLKKAYREGQFPDLRIPKRNIIIPDSVSEILDLLHKIKTEKKLIALDIEGGIGTMSCISFAQSPYEAFIIPLSGRNGNYYSTEEEECSVWKALSSVLCDPLVPKVLQNSLYDRFVLQYSYNIPVLGVVDDTMLKHWELYCELEKSLGVQTSIYTDEPYYKYEIKSGDTKTFWSYCCKDSLVTHEINGKLDLALRAISPSWQHYRFNVGLLNPLLYMELRGIKYDYEKAKNRRASTLNTLYSLQHELDSSTDHGVRGLTKDQLIGVRNELMCYKRDSTQPKKGFSEDYVRTNYLLSKYDSLIPAELGEFSTLLKLNLNVESPKQCSKYLYEILKLPLQTNKEGQTTSDEGALLRLRKKVSKMSLAHTILNFTIRIRRLGTKVGMLSIHPDNDGRIRCGYNIVGTETGRLTCYTSPTGSGYNLQTIPSEDRDLFTGDDNFRMFQCDLSGADGWTIGAHCATLGDRTMLDDLLNGIKPAKVLCLGLRGQTQFLSPSTTREAIREACKTVKKEDWDYFACKIGIWGSCYLMGPDTLRNHLFEESDGELDWNRNEAVNFQRLIFLRYQVKRWHDFTSRKLANSPTITAASGHRRVFFGRREEILGKALAHEPQANTTYATNLALDRLWKDPENRMDKKLRIEPLHQVHDAILGQFYKDDTDWAVVKIKSYFNNPLLIAGQKITIPFEGNYGPSWGELNLGSI
jgi:DNA polymerase